MGATVKTDQDVAVIRMQAAGSLTWSAGEVIVLAADAAHVLPSNVFGVLERLATQGEKREQAVVEPPQPPQIKEVHVHADQPLRGRSRGRQSTDWIVDGCKPVQPMQARIMIPLADLMKLHVGVGVPAWELNTHLLPSDLPRAQPRISEMIHPDRGYMEASVIDGERRLELTKLGQRLVDVHGKAMRQHMAEFSRRETTGRGEHVLNGHSAAPQQAEAK